MAAICSKSFREQCIFAWTILTIPSKYWRLTHEGQIKNVLICKIPGGYVVRARISKISVDEDV